MQCWNPRELECLLWFPCKSRYCSIVLEQILHRHFFENQHGLETKEWFWLLPSDLNSLGAIKALHIAAKVHQSIEAPAKGVQLYEKVNGLLEEETFYWGAGVLNSSTF